MIPPASGFGFTGGVVVVTGAASGIGRASAELLASEQLTVAAWDRDPDGLADVAAAIGSRGGRCVPVECDVTDRAAVVAAWETTRQVGVPRYLVNNAGPPSSADLTIGAGLVAAAASMAAVGDGWLAIAGAQAEAMTLTSSIAGTWAAGGTVAWYPMAKAAIAAYGRHVAATCGGRPRANIVQPGLIATPRMQRLIGSDQGRALIERNPLGRAGAPEEIASVIAFLLSPMASYVNGATVVADGGGVL